MTLLRLSGGDCDSHVDRCDSQSCIGRGVSSKELFELLMLLDATHNAAEAVIDTLVVSILGDRCVGKTVLCGSGDVGLFCKLVQWCHGVMNA